MTTPTHPPLDIPALRRLEAAATRGPWDIVGLMDRVATNLEAYP
jgi:hypothetical protein